jgi:hypothetical protein
MNFECLIFNEIIKYNLNFNHEEHEEKNYLTADIRRYISPQTRRTNIT